jgi:hypothetical protein
MVFGRGVPDDHFFGTPYSLVQGFPVQEPPMKVFQSKNMIRDTLLIAMSMVVLACGRNETMASRSADAYREAREKGEVVGGGHEHGGHEVATATGGTAAVDPSAHAATTDQHAGHDMTSHGTTGDDAHVSKPGTDHRAHGSMPATDHAAMGHPIISGAHAAHSPARGSTMDHGDQGRAPGADHTQHGGLSGAGADHSAHAPRATTAAQDPHAGMQHGTSTSTTAHAQHPPSGPDHAGHGAVPPVTGSPSTVPNVPASSAEMARAQPAATLRPDPFDAAMPVAVAEARKATAGGEAPVEHNAPSGTTVDPHAGHGQAGEASEPQAIYVCPMHPEVTSTTPGTCPKCGMSLVKKEQ